MIAERTVKDAIQQQRRFFSTGQTKPVEFRLEQLKRLKRMVQENQSAILEALKADLNKPAFEAYETEMLVLRDINYAIKHVKSWMRPQQVGTALEHFPGSARIYPEPLGVVLIIGPWNYPFFLMIAPLVGAIAAGNCAILKPSEIAPHTSKLVADLVQKQFDPGFITAIEGGVEISQQLLAEKFDHILFTGGPAVGKIVMEAAAKHLTPVTLELGGKSPCIVEADVQLERAAKRITWGKFLNAGQTCIAPDYLLVNRKIEQDLLAGIERCIRSFYGDNPATSPDYARAINQRHFTRLKTLLQTGKIRIGGETNPEDCYIAPTILEDVSLDDPVMQEEIFGPILPVIGYDDLDDAIALVNARPKPLALYFFSRDQQKQTRILKETSSGGICINDTILHTSVTDLPFGGVGNSGLGSYRGKHSFDTFSHQKSVLKRAFWLDVDVRYAPYLNKIRLLKLFIN